MCFDLIKEGIVDKFRWFANKLGIIANDEDQVDEDQTRYANFEYDTSTQQQQQQQQPRKTSGKQSVRKTKSNETLGEPPAYDYQTLGNKWLKNIRDKNDGSNNTDRKKGIKTKDEKH